MKDWPRWVTIPMGGTNSLTRVEKRKEELYQKRCSWTKMQLRSRESSSLPFRLCLIAERSRPAESSPCFAEACKVSKGSRSFLLHSRPSAVLFFFFIYIPPDSFCKYAGEGGNSPMFSLPRLEMTIENMISSFPPTEG